jgi:hypothetical protein
MGMNLNGPIFLQRIGCLSYEKNRLLDIGPQTIYFARPDQIREFIANQGGSPLGESDLSREIERLADASEPRAHQRTTMLSEITDLTNIAYQSIDVCPGLKNTKILDLNFDRLPWRMRRRYDVVLNFGTTEHIVNQWNCFEVIHDAIKVGGVVYHQLPASGYLDHGYFCYTPLFFEELAKANKYEILKMAVTHAGSSFIDELGVQSVDGDTILHEEKHLADNNRIPSLNLHIVMRKTVDQPFRTLLELATAHSSVDFRVAWRYRHMGLDLPFLFRLTANQMRARLRIRSRLRALRGLATPASPRP